MSTQQQVPLTTASQDGQQDVVLSEKDRTALALQILTNEQSILASALSTTAAEMNSRVSLFFTVLSAAVVSISFISQLTGFRENFYYFAAMLLIILILIGIATYIRLIELSIQGFVHVRGMNRIRHYFAEVAPKAGEHFVQSQNDDYDGVAATLGIAITPGGTARPWWVSFYTSTGLVAVIVSLLGGMTINLLTWLWGSQNGLLLTLELVGVITLMLFLLLRYEASRWNKLKQRSAAKFPSDPEV